MLDILILYGSYRQGRMGIRLADYLLRGLAGRGHRTELIDARAVGLPMLDQRYKDYPSGTAPPAMERLATRLRAADGFVFVAGEYNWGVQPGLKNLVDHYVEEWAGRPALLASYSAGRLGGARANLAWHGTLASLGVAVVPATLTVGQIQGALDADGRPTGDGGAALDRAFPQVSAELERWAAAAKAGTAQTPPA